MLFSLLGPLWPNIRSCGSGGGLTSPPLWIIVLTVLLYVVLAIRGDDLATVAGYTAALTATALMLVRLARRALRPIARGGRG